MEDERISKEIPSVTEKPDDPNSYWMVDWGFQYLRQQACSQVNFCIARAEWYKERIEFYM